MQQNEFIIFIFLRSVVIMINSKSIQITKGSDNIFEDLGFETEEAMNLKIRADLMIKLRSYIEAQGWRQKHTDLYL